MQFYESSTRLVESVCVYLEEGFASGAAGIAIATSSHLQLIEQGLRERGVDLNAARERGQYWTLDAADTLAQFMRDDWPQEQAFLDSVGAVIHRARSRYANVRAFGEMVALLWQQEKYAAAVQLENLWNGLAGRQAFTLLCAYPMKGFDQQEHQGDFAAICKAHTHVIPAESYTALSEPEERLQAVSVLQQKAKVLEREIQRREALERQLTRVNETLEQRIRERTAELRHSELQFSRLVDAVDDYAIYMLDVEGRIVTWNPGAERIKGYTREEILGKHFSLFYSEEDRAAGVPQRALETARQTGKYQTEAWRVRKNGSPFWAHVLLDAIRDSNGALLGFAKITRDMTEARLLEEKLRQSQKMEAIGQLTGGVAHDFNNLLTVIIGSLETIWREVPERNAKLRRAVDHATRGAQRAATLTQQLLAFSRRQPLNPKPTNVNGLVSGMSELLRRTLGENIAIQTALADGLWPVEIDSHQLENALLNLAVNARDAMRGDGRLMIETTNIHLDGSCAAGYPDLTPGEYVVIGVSDTGVGMSEEVAARAFEPFFTTKPLGQGTGLGLSQVYGFVKQSGGHIKIYSEPQLGTTIKIFLPRLSDAAMGEEQDAAAASAFVTPVARHETVLVVEDDTDVRFYSTESLRELGFSVLEAADAPSALRMLDAHPEVQLLFTDVGLPGLNGRELVERARLGRPTLKVLFTTGYARNAFMHHTRLQEGVELLTKPFNRMQLARSVREVLDSAATKNEHCQPVPN